MVTIRPKVRTQMRMTGNCRTHSRTEISAHGLESIIDEPLERGGTNLGFTPTETLVAALIGCTNVISHKIAAKHNVEFRDMTVEADATLDRRGAILQEEIDVPFPKIVLTINLSTPSPPDAIEKVRSELNMYCPVSKVLRQAGTEIEEVWNVDYV